MVSLRTFLAIVGSAFVVFALLAALASVRGQRSAASDRLLRNLGLAALAVAVVGVFVLGSWLVASALGGPIVRFGDAPAWVFPVGVGVVLVGVIGLGIGGELLKRRETAETLRRWRTADTRIEAGEAYTAPGIQLALAGGPLDGRTAHVTNPRESLWVSADDAHKLQVVSAERRPPAPAGTRLVGRYVVDQQTGALRWDDDA